jgi:methyl-accepting chemotaxis protein
VFAVVLLFFPVLAATALAVGSNLIAAMGVSLVLCLIAGAALFATPSGIAPLLGVALIGQCIVLTGELAGHPWQVDSHMVFFAALAVLVLLRDIPTILAGTALIAVHHLGLTFFLPSLVYPSSDIAENLARTVIHAVVVLVEAAALCAAIKRQSDLMKVVEERMAADAETASLQQQKEVEASKAVSQQQSAAASVISASLERLSQGDLSARIETELEGEFATIKDNFNASLDQLTRMIEGVLSTSSAISMGSDSLASSARHLAERTEQQAASLAETTATISQLKSSVELTAQNADDADAKVNSTRKLAENGKSIVEATVTAMTEIENGSVAISKIISTIDDIAFQTNLLALNAGVEAARAGSAGQGFAVVAAEVRALAQRSGEAAGEIKGLIESSQQQVENGASLTTKASEALIQISEQVVQVSEVVAEINASAQAQATGISEIDSAMVALDNLTQQNAAMVEETTAASEELKADVSELTSGAAAFRLSSDERAAA